MTEITRIQDRIFLIEVDCHVNIKVSIFDNREHLRLVMVQGQKHRQVTEKWGLRGYFDRTPDQNSVTFLNFEDHEEWIRPLVLQTFEEAEFEYWYGVYLMTCGGNASPNVFVHVCANYELAEIDNVFEHDDGLAAVNFNENGEEKKEDLSVPEAIHEGIDYAINGWWWKFADDFKGKIEDVVVVRYSPIADDLKEQTEIDGGFIDSDRVKIQFEGGKNEND